MNHSLKSVDDAALWLRFKASDEAAFTVLSTRYYRKLVHYGQKFTSNLPLIEDAVQELLIHLWLYRENVGEPVSVRFYLLKAFRHQLFKTLKQAGVVRPSDEAADLPALDFSVEETYIHQESDSALHQKVERLLATLPPRQREILYLRFFENLMPEEIGQLLTMRAQSVSNTIQRALRSLRATWLIALLLLMGAILNG